MTSFFSVLGVICEVAVDQRGPTTFELLAILQKYDNSRTTSNKMMYKKQIHNIQN